MSDFAAYGLTGLAAVVAIAFVTVLRSAIYSVIRRIFR